MKYVEIYRDATDDGVFVVEKGDDGSYRGVAKYSDGPVEVLFDKPSADATIAHILDQTKKNLDA